MVAPWGQVVNNIDPKDVPLRKSWGYKEYKEPKPKAKTKAKKGNAKK